MPDKKLKQDLTGAPAAARGREKLTHFLWGRGCGGGGLDLFLIWTESRAVSSGWAGGVA